MKCFVHNCENNSRNKSSRNIFFRFPKDEDLKKQWLKFCRKEEVVNLKDARVCNEHFRDEDIRGQLQFEMGLCKTRNLMPGSVPCINKNDISLAKQERIQKHKNRKIVEELLRQASAEEEAILSLVSEAEANPVVAQPEELYLETYIQTARSAVFSSIAESNTEEETVINLNKCRTCYQYYMADDKAIDLYQEQHCYLLDEIKLIAGVSIKIQAGVPQYICSICLEDLNRAIHFRETCIRTEEQLQRLENQAKQVTDPFNIAIKDEFIIEDEYDLLSRSATEVVEVVDKANESTESNDDEFWKTESDSQIGRPRLVLNPHDPHNVAVGKGILLKFLEEYTIKNVEESEKANFANSNDLKQATLRKSARVKRSEHEKLTLEEMRKIRIERRRKAPRNYICDKCGFAFQSSHSLRAHLFRHDGIKKYQCTECPKRFYTNYTRNNHVQTVHRGQKLFGCRHCTQTFSYSTSRYLHEKDVHSQNPVKKKPVRYPCSLCERSYVKRYDLRQHMNMHTGNRPFKCQICGKAFAKQIVARKHEKIHNPKSYKCDICSECFITRADFNSHRRTHSIQRPYRCEWCDVAFQHNHQLSAHRRKKTHLENEQILGACFEVDLC